MRIIFIFAHYNPYPFSFSLSILHPPFSLENVCWFIFQFTQVFLLLCLHRWRPCLLTSEFQFFNSRVFIIILWILHHGCLRFVYHTFINWVICKSNTIFFFLLFSAWFCFFGVIVNFLLRVRFYLWKTVLLFQKCYNIPSGGEIQSRHIIFIKVRAKTTELGWKVCWRRLGPSLTPRTSLSSWPTRGLGYLTENPFSFIVLE